MNKFLTRILSLVFALTAFSALGATATFTADTSSELDTNNERGWYYIPKAAEWCNGSLQTFRDGQGAIPQKARLFYYEWLPGSSSATVTSDLACARAAGVKVIFTPVYCDVVNCNEGVTISQLEAQMAAIAPTLMANRDVIAVFRMGLIGAFGEWANSGAGLDTVANKVRVRNAVLSAVPPEIPIVTRHPWDLVSWYPTPTSSSNALTGAPVSKFGVFNDCYLSNPDDQFTYPTSVPTTVVDLTITQTPAQGRAYAAAQTRYAPFGGETCDSAGAVNRLNCIGGVDNAGLAGGIMNEGPRYHQTFLHRGYFVGFYDNWASTAGGNCYGNVTNLLGYRFQYDGLDHPDSITQGATATFTLRMRNYGWSIIHSLRQAQVRLVKSGATDIVCKFTPQLRTLPPQATTSTTMRALCPIPSGATVGSYSPYLEIPDVFPQVEAVKTYRIQPANANNGAQLWDATSRRFATGTTISVNASAGAALTAIVNNATVSGIAGSAITSVAPVVGSGGAGGYTCTISPALPTGLSFSGSTCVVSGTTSVTGNTTETVTVTDSASAHASNTFSLNIAASGGTFAIRTSGSNFVDGNGTAIQLRGANVAGMEYVAIQGWAPADPWGNQHGNGSTGPNWTAMSNVWKMNVARIPLNEASWLGYSVAKDHTALATLSNPDPGANYKATVASSIAAANAAGLYVILDLHWSAPNDAGVPLAPFGQNTMAGADHAVDFWTSVAGTFKNNPAVMFELFNEPFPGGWSTSGSTGPAGRVRDGGASPFFLGDANAGTNISLNWTFTGMQAMLNAVRATGATNVVLIGNDEYDQQITDAVAYMPNDPTPAGYSGTWVKQLAAAWHPYPIYYNGSGVEVTDGTGTPQVRCVGLPSCSPGALAAAVSTQSAGYPVIATEFGDYLKTTSGANSPWVSMLLPFADTHFISYVGWAWDVYGDNANVLIRDGAGTPSFGYGEYVKAHYIAQSGGSPPTPPTAAVLSSPSVGSVTGTTASAAVTSNAASGTLYVVATTTNSQPTNAQIKAGSGGTIARATNVPAAIGVNTIPLSGLTGSTTYYTWFLEDNGADSNVAAASSFTTSASTPSTLSIGASSSFGSGFSNSAVTPAITTQASGSTFVLLLNRAGSSPDAPTSVTDNKGNTFTQRASAFYNGGNQRLMVYDCQVCAGGTGHVVTAAFGTSNAVVAVLVEIKGGGVFDKAGSVTTSASATTLATSSITTTSADVVLSFFGGADYTNQTSITDSFGNVVQTVLAGASYGATGAVGAFAQTSGGGAISDTFTFGVGVTGGAIIVAWHP